MGQGTDSCGGWEVDFNPYEEYLEAGRWTQRDGSLVHLSAMTLGHLRNARELARRKSAVSTFTSEAETWDAWVDAFTSEIEERARAKTAAGAFVPSKASAAGRAMPAPAPKSIPKAKAVVRGAMVKMRCHCSGFYLAREADLKRGWGLSCSKHCAAVRRDYNKPAATRA